MNKVIFLLFLLLLAGWAGSQAEILRPEDCGCTLTSGILSDKAENGSTAQVNVATCMEPRPCNPESLDVTSLSPSDAQITEEMEEKLKAKGDIYALLEFEPDGKTWDPAIEITVVLESPAPRNNFSLSILRWIDGDNDWRKEGTAIADKEGDMTAKGAISHTSIFAFVEETAGKPASVAETPPDITVIIPDVVGMPITAAEERLRGKNLNVSLFRKFDAGAEPGTVISMEPRPGQEVDLETYVILIVSAGPEKAGLIPDVIGLTLPDAVKTLKQVGLTATGYRNQKSEAEDGTVIGIEPSVGTKVAVDEEIFLIVAENPTVLVPDLIGDPIESAIESLPRYGLTAGQLISIESSQPGEIVIDMQPGVGTEVAFRTVVDLYYAITETVEVPDVTGYHFADAIAMLQEWGLNRGDIIEVEPEYPYTEAGTVRYTDPQAGAVIETGSVVNLFVVGVKVERVEVPDVTGYHVEDAIAMLQRFGLNRGDIVEIEPEYPYTEAGVVRYTAPQSGAIVDIGSAVDLYVVVVEVEPVKVPDVTGYHVEDAIAMLQEWGLNRGDIVEVEPEYPYTEAGTVRHTDPQAGAVVDIGSAVDLYVVVVEVEPVKVPDVTGYHVADAEAMLQRFGLNRGDIIEVEPEYPYTEPGTVRYTDQPAGAIVEIGSAIDLYVVGVEVEPVVVPDVTGYHFEDAIAMLQRLGLNRGDIIEVEPEYPYTEPGTVRYTDQPAGAIVEIGSAIDLYVVGVEVEPVVVPDVSGLPLAAAEEILLKELKIGVVFEVESKGEYGTVLRTDPQANTPVEKWSPIDIYVVGPKQVTVPDVTGYIIERAVKILAGSELEIGNIIEVEGEGEYGTVLRTDPQAYTPVERWTPVNLYVVGSKQLTVPDVTGYIIEGAVNILAGSELEIGNIIEVEGQGEYGTVLGTDP